MGKFFRIAVLTAILSLSSLGMSNASYIATNVSDLEPREFVQQIENYSAQWAKQDSNSKKLSFGNVIYCGKDNSTYEDFYKVSMSYGAILYMWCDENGDVSSIDLEYSENLNEPQSMRNLQYNEFCDAQRSFLFVIGLTPNEITDFILAPETKEDNKIQKWYPRIKRRVVKFDKTSSNYPIVLHKYSYYLAMN